LVLGRKATSAFSIECCGQRKMIHSAAVFSGDRQLIRVFRRIHNKLTRITRVQLFYQPDGPSYAKPTAVWTRPLTLIILNLKCWWLRAIQLCSCTVFDYILKLFPRENQHKLAK